MLQATQYVFKPEPLQTRAHCLYMFTALFFLCCFYCHFMTFFTMKIFVCSRQGTLSQRQRKHQKGRQGNYVVSPLQSIHFVNELWVEGCLGNYVVSSHQSTCYESVFGVDRNSAMLQGNTSLSRLDIEFNLFTPLFSNVYHIDAFLKEGTETQCRFSLSLCVPLIICGVNFYPFTNFVMGYCDHFCLSVCVCVCVCVSLCP